MIFTTQSQIESSKNSYQCSLLSPKRRGRLQIRKLMPYLGKIQLLSVLNIPEGDPADRSPQGPQTKSWKNLFKVYQYGCQFLLEFFRELKSHSIRILIGDLVWKRDGIEVRDGPLGGTLDSKMVNNESSRKYMDMPAYFILNFLGILNLVLKF